MFRVRKMNVSEGDADLIVDLPRNRTVAQLREYIHKEWNIPAEDQKLYYQGKELIDIHKLIEYRIQRNHIVQLLIRSKQIEALDKIVPVVVPDSIEKVEENVEEEEEDDKENLEPSESKFYKVGDKIDFKLGAAHGWDGAWFEAEIVEILADPNLSPSGDERNIVFMCTVHRYDYMKPFKGKFEDIRPRSRQIYDISELTEGMKVLANVNIDEPNKRGLWYDIEIKSVSKKNIEAVVIIAAVPVHCNLNTANEYMKIEEPVLLADRGGNLPVPSLRKYPADCVSCQDNKRRNCKQCGCHICAKKDRPELLLLCDECNMGFHISCLVPPLEKLPDEEHWYCKNCKNDETEIVRAGEALKHNSKLSKMPAVKGNSSRDWDNGMACAGRSKECTIVPKNHFGPVPGVDVGTVWKFRAQVSEAGIHRPLVAGIHGRSDEGAYSIVVSGGYEDDVDNGDEFEYTGAGGRDLSGNKRVNDQTCDQKLEHTNKALAMCCNAKFKDVTGATAVNWKDGKPVRVVRKHGKSKYAPQDGYRYDGIYKVVKYYPEEGKSGFIVWKYLLRRDDPSPSPWKEGAPVFQMIYPADYDEYEAKKQQRRAEKALTKKKSPKVSKSKKGVKSGDKRKQTSILDFQSLTKKPKMDFGLSAECTKWIKEDVMNKKYWDECRAKLKEGKMVFTEFVSDTFTCICCQALVHKPITLNCQHNVCKFCLERSFGVRIYSCPNCRDELGKNYEMKENTTLSKILLELFPGYDGDR